MIAICILQSIHRAQRLETPYCTLLKQLLMNVAYPYGRCSRISPRRRWMMQKNDIGEGDEARRVDVSMQGRVGFFLMQSLMFTESFSVWWVQQRLPYRTAPSIILPNAIHSLQMQYFPPSHTCSHLKLLVSTMRITSPPLPPPLYKLPHIVNHKRSYTHTISRRFLLSFSPNPPPSSLDRD